MSTARLNSVANKSTASSRFSHQRFHSAVEAPGDRGFITRSLETNGRQQLVLVLLQASTAATDLSGQSRADVAAHPPHRCRMAAVPGYRFPER